MMSRILSVDMGCGNTKIASEGEGVIYSQPTCVVAGEGKGIIAAGEGALEYIRCGQTGQNIRCPVETGGIANKNLAGRMIKSIVKALFAGERKQYLKGVFCVPEGLTEAQREMYEDIALDSGMGEVYFVNGMVACAQGADINTQLPFGTLVLDIGHGKIQCGVVAMGECITSKCIQKGGGSVTDNIISYILNEYGIEVGFAMAEEIKQTKEETKEFYGRYIENGASGKGKHKF